MNEQLQRAYDALQQADAAGNAEDAQQLADFIRELEAQMMVQEEKKEKPGTDSMLENPVTYGMAGAVAGRVLGPAVGAGIDTAARSMMNRKPPAPGAAPAAPAAPRMEPSMAPPQPARIPEPPPAVGQGAMKNVAHNVEEVLANRPAMSLTKQPEPGFEARPGRLIATPIGADLSTEAPPPPTRSAAQLSAPPAATPPAAPPKPSMLSRMSRRLAEPKKTPLYLGGAMAAGQGRDAYEQAREGNIGQAAMSGAGAVGGLGMLSRIKPIRAAGTLMGLGVPLTRMYKSLTEDEENVERRAAGGLAGYAKGKMVKEIAAGKTPTALKNILESKQAPMLRPTGEGSLLPKVDSPYIAEYSDVLPQKRLTRGTNPRMDRLQSDPRAYEAIEKAIQHGVNIDPKLAQWYGTNRLMTGMLNEGRSVEDFERLMKHMASASQRNPVPQQNKMGSLLNYLDTTGQLGAPGTKLALPKGYGSLAQSDIVKRAQQIGADEYPFDDAIKLGKFYKSYLGYHPENAVVDVIGTRVPTMATRDPEWLVKRLKVGKPKEGYQIISPQDMFKRGELTMEEALKRPGFWEAAPTKVGEYAGIEDMWKSSAKGAGYKSGEGQALGWYGSAGLDDAAGLKSKPMTWEESLEQNARERAKQTGKHPLDVMNKFLKGEGHLKAGGLARMVSGGFRKKEFK
jgi:hypothetical protein